jgi:CDP-diacylglycerol--serine O-phosphatidyltransferase
MVKRTKTRKVRRLPRIKGQSISKLVPNMITVAATCAGLTGVKFALDAKWEHAVIAIIVAAVLDALDGRMARLLKSASDFGAELDSLSDFVAFGVSPAFILYFWTLHSLGRVGWIVALFLAICCGLRLARFNTNIGKLPPYAYNYFTGVPAPAGAGLALLPMMGMFAYNIPILQNPILIAVWSVVVAILMVSRVPTYSFKAAKVPQSAMVPILVLVALLAAGLAGAPWMTLTTVGLVYIMSFGLSVLTYRRLKIEAERLHGERRDGEDSDSGADGGDASGPPQLRSVE